jgi:hypothetical protein
MYKYGDHADIAAQDVAERTAQIRSGAKLPTEADVRLAQLKLERGGYPIWEHTHAQAIIESAQRRGMLR